MDLLKCKVIKLEFWREKVKLYRSNEIIEMAWEFSNAVKASREVDGRRGSIEKLVMEKFRLAEVVRGIQLAERRECQMEKVKEGMWERG